MSQVIDIHHDSKHEVRVQILKNPEKNAILNAKHASLPFVSEHQVIINKYYINCIIAGSYTKLL